MNRMTYCSEEIFRLRVRQLVSGSKVLLLSLVCSSRSPLPLAQLSQQLSGGFHQRNGTFLESVPRKEHRSSSQVVPARLRRPKGSVKVAYDRRRRRLLIILAASVGLSTLQGL